MTARLDRSFNALSVDAASTDEEIVRAVLAGDHQSFGLLMRRYNQRLYRVCRAVLPNDGEAEEAVQEAYLKAYQYLGQFENRAKFSTWLTKIAFHEALARKRRMMRWVPFDAGRQDEARGIPEPAARTKSPEGQAIHDELTASLERAIDNLPDNYRAVFVLRHVQGLSTDETSTCLGLTQEAVKSRLMRSRGILQHRLRSHYGGASERAFRFLGARCDRLTERVLRSIDRASAARAV